MDPAAASWTETNDYGNDGSTGRIIDDGSNNALNCVVESKEDNHLRELTSTTLQHHYVSFQSEESEQNRNNDHVQSVEDQKGKLIAERLHHSTQNANAPSVPDADWHDHVVSLREWLSKPDRRIDSVENLYIFKQIAEFVELAHSQDVVLGNIRPSSFLLSSLSRITVIESASSRTASSSSEESTGRASMHASSENERIGTSTNEAESGSNLKENDAQDKSEASCSEDKCDHGSPTFPMKKILSMETAWYKSPEEQSGASPSFASDVYSLGVFLFELFFRYESLGKWSKAMSELRHRFLPPNFLLDHPKEAAFCLLLLHPNSSSRPGARDILHADIFNDVKDDLVEREAIMNFEEKVLEAEITLNFLLQLRQEKNILIQNLSQELHTLHNDIKEVRRWQNHLRKNELRDDKFHNISDADKGGKDSYMKIKAVNCAGHDEEGSSSMKREYSFEKSSQLMRNFSNLKEIYLSMINRSSYAVTQNVYLERSDTSNCSKVERSIFQGRLGGFFEDLCGFLKYNRLDVKAALQYGDMLNTKNMVCSLSFDCSDGFFATAGVCRRIKIFEYNALLEEPDSMHYPIIEMTSRRKLSCVCWSKFHRNHLATSDLEGAVHLWDVTTGQTIMAFEEHNKCVWSVDFCHNDPVRLASGSDDYYVKLWSTNQGTNVGSIKTKANVCSVQFSPDHPHMLAFGSADSQVYLYDLRHIRVPICILKGHQRAVSFIRFMDSKNIVSASTDNTMKLWDFTAKMKVKATRSSGDIEHKSGCVRTYKGHTNLKNFVGLSVVEGGYIACGSETNEVFVYHKSLPMGMLSHRFGYADPFSGQETDDNGSQFVSSVCWKQNSQMLVAANSVGNIKILEMV